MNPEPWFYPGRRREVEILKGRMKKDRGWGCEKGKCDCDDSWMVKRFAMKM